MNCADDGGRCSPETNPAVETLIEARITRRGLLKGVATTALVAAGGPLAGRMAWAAADPSTLKFVQPEHVIGKDDRVAPGYTAKVLIRWGDPVLRGAPRFDPSAPGAGPQALQFGYNNDYIGFLPLPRGSARSDHGLLWVNHEYTDPQLMFAGFLRAWQTAAQTAVEIAAHGASVIEVRRREGAWSVVDKSPYARRITGMTAMRIAGPAAGHAKLRTAADPNGTRVLGTLNNCAGGKTPWGTVLTAEENFHQYFRGAEKRYGIGPEPAYPWWKSVPRFDGEREPNEPNRFGWLVEVDPYDPSSVPVKRTALGRMRHEGASVVLNKDGRVVVYSGDDQAFEYMYRFVTARRYDPERPDPDLLDEGTLFVARFTEGRVRWLPLVQGEGPLTAANGFRTQGDVALAARRAADLVGATPMDRPEEVQLNPVNGRIYVMLTNNATRTEPNPPNPRAPNVHGHVLELVPPGGSGAEADHAADEFAWDFVLLAGNPKEPGSAAKYHPATEVWLSSPDNCAFDPRGRMWIATDQGSKQAVNRIPDGMYALDVEGAGRALVKLFYAAPRGAEMCGPEFTPDGTTLFVSVQHPAEERGSTFENPSTRWPDFKPGVPPRPSVVAITKDDGGLIGD
jgi:secreted PhoX family phosphatase